jgi:AcrR family transcriptional regulator
MTDDSAASDPRWRRLPEERPGQILEAAVAVFAEHGIAAAKLEEIAIRAGVSKGTIYLYFASKEELFREVVRQTVVPRIAQADAIPRDGSASEQIERYLAHHWKQFSGPASEGWVRLVLLELHKFPDLARFYKQEVVERSNRVLGDIIRRGVESGEFRQVDPEVTVRMIKALLLMHVLWSGARSLSPHSGGDAQPRTLRDITDFVVHALQQHRSLERLPEDGAPPA